MPTPIHEKFIAGVEDAINNQLRLIREGSSRAATFAQKVRRAGSSYVYLPVDDAPSGAKSKYEPDASFWHDGAKYPGVIIEVSYSQKRKKLGRLADDYLLDSNGSVQVVVGLDIEYGKKLRVRRCCRCGELIWPIRPMGMVQEIADEVCPVLV